MAEITSGWSCACRHLRGERGSTVIPLAHGESGACLRCRRSCVAAARAATTAQPALMHRAAIVLLTVVAALPASLRAQQDTAAFAARVRVATPNLPATAGLLLAATADSLLIGFSHRAGSPLAVPRIAVTSFQISRDRGGARTAPIAAQIGAAGGAIMFALRHAYTDPGNDWREDAGAGLIGAAVGAGVGAAIGKVASFEGWKRAQLPPPSSPSLLAREQWPSLEMSARVQQFRAGSSIRLQTRDGRIYEGRYAGFGSGVARVEGDSSWAVPAATIVQIFERSTRARAWFRRGAWVGGALALGAIGTVALRTNEEECARDSCVHPWAFAPSFTLIGAYTGAAIGGIAGSYRWEWRQQRW